MPAINVVIESKVSQSTRARQIYGMFDVPPGDTQRLEWQIDAPIEAEPWSVGLIVGPSGAGKSTLARHLWPEEYATAPQWTPGVAVIDSFDPSLSIADVTNACQSVGFSTIPAWTRPNDVISTGEKFRVDIARRLLESPPDRPIVVDEFTSVVDRQVAQIASYAIQKYIRRQGRQLVAVSCHHDIIDWLQPDWIIEPAQGKFTRRSLQQRPEIDIEIKRVSYETWHTFAPFHYLSADLNRAAKCFGLFANGQLAAFCGVLHLPVSQKKSDHTPIWKASRTATLPDYQGLGLAFVLGEAIGSLYKRAGCRFRKYPAHPSFIASHAASKMWRMTTAPGKCSKDTKKNIKTSLSTPGLGSRRAAWRPCAVFEYAGPAYDGPVEMLELLK